MMLISLFKTLFKTLFPLCLLVVTPTILSTMVDASTMLHQQSSITEAFNVSPIPDSSAPMVTGNLTGSAINLGRMGDELIVEITPASGCNIPVFSLDYILEITNQEELIKSSNQDESFFVFLKRFICVSSLDYILERANQELAKFSTKEGDKSFLLPELPRQFIYFTLGWSLVVIGCCAIILAKIVLSDLKIELQLYPPTMCGGQHCSIQRKTLSSKDVPIKLSFEATVDEEQELAPPSIHEELASNSSSAVPIPSTSVHFELEKNQVHEIIHVTEYSQAEKECCWYTRQEFGDMQNNARIQEIVGPAYDHDNFLESGVPAMIFVPVSEEEVNRFTGPAFVDYRDPPKDEDFEDEDEESIAASPIKVHPATTSSASTVDDMDDLLKAFSKLSLDETNIETPKTIEEPANNVQTEQQTKPTENSQALF